MLHFRFIFDAMHAVTGAYAKPIFVDKLGASPVRSAPGIFGNTFQLSSKFVIADVRFAM